MVQQTPPRRRGSIGIAMLWYFFLSLLLFWLPVAGPFIAGVVGGRAAGGVGRAVAAVFLPSIVSAAIIFVFSTSLSGVPLLGALLAAGSLVLTLAHVGPLLLGAIIGGLLAPRDTIVVSVTAGTSPRPLVAPTPMPTASPRSTPPKPQRALRWQQGGAATGENASPALPASHEFLARSGNPPAPSAPASVAFPSTGEPVPAPPSSSTQRPAATTPDPVPAVPPPPPTPRLPLRNSTPPPKPAAAYRPPPPMHRSDDAEPALRTALRAHAKPPATLKHVSVADGGSRFAVEYARTVLGRDQDGSRPPDVDLGRLAGSETVSGRHAELYLNDGHWHVRDIGSANGVFVKPRGSVDFQPRIRGPVRLRNGDQLGLGSVILEFIVESQ